jgi:hypothetical protein
VSVDLCAVFNEATSLETIAARPINGQSKPDDWVPSPDSLRGRAIPPRGYSRVRGAGGPCSILPFHAAFVRLPPPSPVRCRFGRAGFFDPAKDGLRRLADA